MPKGENLKFWQYLATKRESKSCINNRFDEITVFAAAWNRFFITCHSNVGQK